MKPGKVILQVVFAILLSGCFQTQTVAPITAAENIRKTADGRIFVSGDAAIFEILPDGQGAYQAEAITQQDPQNRCAYYAGLAELNGWLFYVCTRFKAFSVGDLKFGNAGSLMAYSLQSGEVVMVADLSGFLIANGLDALPDDNAILMADEDIFGKGGVSRFNISFASGVPVVTEMQQHWIGPAQKVYAANGVRVVDGNLFLTDIGFLKKLPLDAQGNPQRAQILYRGATVLDDLAPYCDGVLVADFVMGRLIYASADGDVIEKTRSGFASPSSLLPDASPMFDASQLLVTESYGLTAGKGNRLAAITWDELGISACR